MAEYFKVQLLGAKETTKILAKMPQELADKVYMQALRRGATLIRNSARDRAPYGSDFSKRSFTRSKKGVESTQLFKLRDQIKISVTTKTPVSYAVAVHVGKAYWGMFQEFGTSKMPARPWLRPAFDEVAEQTIKTIGIELGKGVERTAERLSGSLMKSGLLKRFK